MKAKFSSILLTATANAYSWKAVAAINYFIENYIEIKLWTSTVPADGMVHILNNTIMSGVNIWCTQGVNSK